MNLLPQNKILHKYFLSQFLAVFGLCLLASTSLFIVFDFFERVSVFIKEDSTFLQALSYMAFKIPLIVQLMTPIAVVVATLVSVGKLSQLSEITAMRACGVSLLWLAKPLLILGLLISILSLAFNETIVPWSAKKVDEIYHFDIKKKDQKGNYNQTDFWYRADNKFYNIGLYDSRLKNLNAISQYDFDKSFNLKKRIDGQLATWQGPLGGWKIENVVETSFKPNGDVAITKFSALPLTIKETPEDFYSHKIDAETLNYSELKTYASKLAHEGVPITGYLVELAAKISFPFVNVIVILVAFSFGLIPARSGKMTTSFIAGVTLAFSYHVIHAISLSLGSAELIPITASAWAANIIIGCLGGYLILDADYV
jgi:lipopolysaccharide export system permease protein